MPIKGSGQTPQGSATRGPDIGHAIAPGTKVADIGPDGEVTIDATHLAPLLGLSASTLMRAIRDGIVYQIHETGVGEDEGRTRVIFRYRSRQASLVLDRAGHVLDVV